MQEIKTNPAKPFIPSPRRQTGFSFFGALQNMTILRASTAAEGAQQLLNPDVPTPASVTDSLNTGKLTKLIKYIKSSK